MAAAEQSATPASVLYLASGALTATPPTAATALSRTIVGSTPANPGLGSIVDWGAYTVPAAMTLKSDVLVTVYLTTNQSAVVENLRAYIYRGDTQLTPSGQTGTYVDSQNTGSPGKNNTLSAGKVLKFELGVPIAGAAFAANSKFDLRFVVFGAGAASSAADIAVLYGSAKYPSHVQFVASAGVPATAAFQSYFFADNAYSLEAPTGTADKSRASASSGQASLGPDSLATASAWSWAKTTVSQPTTLPGDSFVSVWVTVQGTAGAMRGLRATLLVNGAIKATQTIGINPWTFPDSSAAIPVVKFSLGLNTTGLVIPAGASIDLQFATFSSSNTNSGQLVILYGSAARPSQLTLGVAPSVAAAPTASAAPATSSSSTPSATTPSSSSAAPSPSQSAAGNETGQDGARAKDAGDAGKLPGFGAWISFAALAAVIVVLARRRT